MEFMLIFVAETPFESKKHVTDTFYLTCGLSYPQRLLCPHCERAFVCGDRMQRHDTSIDESVVTTGYCKTL